MVDVYVAAPTTGADVLAAPWVPVFPGGYLLGSVLLINLVVTHYTRFKFSWPKAGIFLTHIGIVMLLVGQLFTDVFSSESSMRLAVGESRNYAEDFRGNELVLIDESSAEHDVVTSIPRSLLRKGAVISHDSLPFKLRVLESWQNVDFTGESKPGYTNVDADKGFGPKVFVKGLPPATAMDARDMPGALVEAFTDKESLGRWFTAVGFRPRQVIGHDGKEFRIALRIKRYYTPYSLTLIEARHDKYKGTDIPRNFSSIVRVQDPKSGEDREVKIFMNNPLRYAGKTFYQYQMAADEMFLRQGEKPTSTFQVVENPSWLAPYLACVIVGLGLLYQFGFHLKKFFVRKAKANA